MTISKILIVVATLLGSSTIGSAFSPRKASNRKIVTGYSSDENLDVPAPYPQDVGKFWCVFLVWMRLLWLSLCYVVLRSHAVSLFVVPRSLSDEILCSFDDYEEIIYKLQHQREALIRRTQVIDNFLDTLHETLEEDLLGSDPREIPQLAARARTIFQVEVNDNSSFSGIGLRFTQLL
jgi:hypothetical protein